MMTRILFRTRAAFLVNGKWQWHRWNNYHASMHAAVGEKRLELKAEGHDCGNGDHAEESRWNYATQG